MTLPRIYPILDTERLAECGATVEEGAAALLAAGARIVQLRHKAAFSRSLYESAQKMAEACERSGALMILNDRADFALLLGVGLHIGQDDLPPRDARQLIGPKLPMGFSTHNMAQLEASNAEPVDYVALGPIFSTSSKANPDPEVGLKAIEQYRPITQRPLVAIGGITLENARSVWRAGADSVAVVSGLIPNPYTPDALRQRAESWMHLGDE